jgi:hypothetical protein
MNQDDRITELERKVELLTNGLRSTHEAFDLVTKQIDLLKIKTD